MSFIINRKSLRMTSPTSPLLIQLCMNAVIVHILIIYYLIIANLIVHAYNECNEHVNAAEAKNSRL